LIAQTLSLAALFLALAVQAAPDKTLTAGGVELLPSVDDTSPFSVSVRVARGTHADQVVVKYFYNTRVPGIDQDLMLTFTTVVPAAAGNWVAADPAPVSRSKIAWIDVTLVRDVEKQRFAFQEKK
jgi:hypothetical protein